MRCHPAADGQALLLGQPPACLTGLTRPPPPPPPPPPAARADVINQMQTDDMELKKLVYLYLINYAKTQPDLAIMAVNTFVKASSSPGGGLGRRRRCCCCCCCLSRRLVSANPGPLTRALPAHAVLHLASLRGSPTSVPAGLPGPQPPHPRAGSAHHGLHPRGQDHRVPVRPAAPLPEGEQQRLRFGKVGLEKPEPAAPAEAGSGTFVRLGAPRGVHCIRVFTDFVLQRMNGRKLLKCCSLSLTGRRRHRMSCM